MARPRKFVDDEDFVKAWLASSSVKEVADSLGLSVNSASVRAVALRKAGVSLPKYVRRKRDIDVDALNKLIKGYKRK